MATLSSFAIQTYLPHRYPFLMIDRVIEIIPEQTIVTIKNVTINEPFFQGHFPGAPMMPGVLIVEAMAQAASILAHYPHSSVKPTTSDHYILAAIDRVKFKKAVVPGDQLRIRVMVQWNRAPFLKYQAQATVDGELVCTAEITGAKQSSLSINEK
jgi:3-hydroxyacyl-[acyl-carrier-protein] dehydratase